MPRKLRVLRRVPALTRAEKKEQGPVQIIVLGFDDLKFGDQVLAELRRLSSLEVVRLVDAVIVSKSRSGELVRVPAADPSQRRLSWAGSQARSSGSRTRSRKGPPAPRLRPSRSAIFSAMTGPGRSPT